MKQFTYSEMTSDIISDAKQAFKQMSNNAEIKNRFETIANETDIAISNIESVISSIPEFRQLFVGLRKGNIGFASDVLGLQPRGKNGSYYRSYLAKDGKNIVEIRFANHYETKDAAHEKSNNNSQFLYQVILRTSSTTITSDSITTTTEEGNLKVLTNGILKKTSSEEEVKNMLMRIHDYLITPSTSFENAKAITKESKNYKNMKKNVQRINESQLRAIVAESVKKVLSEKYNPWKSVEREDGSIVNPRYEKDTQPYRDRIPDQAEHLYKQIEYFLETLEHAYPNLSNDNSSDRTDVNKVELSRVLTRAKYALEHEIIGDIRYLGFKPLSKP